MSYEDLNHHLEEEAPFNLIKAEPEKISIPEIKDYVLYLNGEKIGDYKYADRLHFQDNGIAAFESSSVDDTREAHFFDPETGDMNFPVITREEGRREEDNLIKVNGFHWKSLDNKRTYWGRTLATVDPITKSVVFESRPLESRRDRENTEIVDDNLVWKNTFDSVSSVESYNGDVLVVANKKNKRRTLYVNDKEWTWHKNEEKGEEDMINAVTNGENLIATVVGSGRANKGKYLNHIFVGDKNGAHQEWNTSFDIEWDKKNFRIVAGKDSKSIAVIGNIDKIPTLVIDDIVCKLNAVPMSVEKLRVEKDGVFVQYTTATGKVLAEKVALKENSKQVQENNKKIENSKNGLKNLHDFLNNEGHSPEKVLEVMASINEVKSKLSSVEQSYMAISENYRKAQQENLDLKEKNINLETDSDLASKQLEIMKENNGKLEQQLNEIKMALKSGKMQGMFSKEFIVTNKKDVEVIKKLIE